MLLESCKFFFGNVCNQLVQGIASGILNFLELQAFPAAEAPSSKVLQDTKLSMLRSPFGSTVQVRDGVDGSKRCSLRMEIVYTQPHNIYYLSRVRSDDDRLIQRGEYEMLIRGI